VPLPTEFAATFNSLKFQAEERMLLRHGSKEECERIVRDKLAELHPHLEGCDVDVVLLVAGAILANILVDYGR